MYVKEQTMKAIVQDRYGPPEVLELRDVDEPEMDDDGVLIRVKASSINPFDWHAMRGEPYIARAMFGLRAPRTRVRGIDVAGVVERVGANVDGLKPGDEVFGTCPQALAELAVGKPERLALKPATATFEQAAAVPVAGLTALQGLRDKGGLEAGDRVLITGASGGVGTFAVQIAKAAGAEVTASCSTPNVELVRSLGADHVLDYTKEDFTKRGELFDVVFYAAGTHSLREALEAVAADGTLVPAGRSKVSNWITPVGLFVTPTIVSKIARKKIAGYMTSTNTSDLLTMKTFIDEGKVTPVIDRTYPLAEAAEAVRYQEQGHARGKVIVTV
jgi:NADPH:quinone reductase-like Zn-dependent oxidoreductase